MWLTLNHTLLHFPPKLIKTCNAELKTLYRGQEFEPRPSHSVFLSSSEPNSDGRPENRTHWSGSWPGTKNVRWHGVTLHLGLVQVNLHWICQWRPEEDNINKEEATVYLPRYYLTSKLNSSAHLPIRHLSAVIGRKLKVTTVQRNWSVEFYAFRFEYCFQPTHSF